MSTPTTPYIASPSVASQESYFPFPEGVSFSPLLETSEAWPSPQSQAVPDTLSSVYHTHGLPIPISGDHQDWLSGYPTNGLPIHNPGDKANGKFTLFTLLLWDYLLLIFIDTIPETPPPSAQSERDTTSFERVSMCQVMQENLALKKKIKRVEKKVTAQKSLKRASRERKRSLRSWKK